MRTPRILLIAAAAAWLAAPAGAAPDAQGSSTFTEPNGAYTVVKTFKVFSATNPDNPAPEAGKYTYVYTITNQPSSVLCITGFDVEIPTNGVAAGDAGALAGPGVAPSATIVGAIEVEWDFNSANPNCTFTGIGIAPGETSQELFLQSAYAPGGVNDTLVSFDGEFSLDTPGDCIGPVVSPDAIACTIGFWKERSEGKKGTTQYFPDEDFDPSVPGGDALLAQAVSLSMGIFTSQQDLLNSLRSSGPRTIQQRAKQQLAATLLSLAAGDLFPANQKCALFEDNPISSNACGTNTTVGSGVNASKTGINGDNTAQHTAQECLDDINNGIGL
jgi:hypothetical protein